MKFHINPKTGDVSQCRATKDKCPFGGIKEHFSTEKEARDFYEKSQQTFIENPYQNLTIEELEAIETKVLAQKIKNKEPFSDEEYDRHYEYVRRIRRANPSTHKTYTKRIKGKVVYVEERSRLHDEIVNDLLKKYESVPREGEVLLIGGIAGSGKSTTLKNTDHINVENYAIVNPDEIKYEMAVRGMTPKIPGLLPLETDELILYESQVINDKFFKAITSTKTNIAIDKTLASSAQMIKTFEELKTLGYENFSGVFVDVDPDEAHKRIRNRHKDGINNFVVKGEGFGERPVPGSAVAMTRVDDPKYRSKNAKNFVELFQNNWFNKDVYVFDSSNGSKEIAIKDFVA